jgi:hypothetical protein
LVVVLACLPGELPFIHIVGVIHAPVKLAVAHFSVLALLQMNDAQVLLKVVRLVAKVHAI